jgi:type IV pilus assembly protein PilZ
MAKVRIDGERTGRPTGRAPRGAATREARRGRRERLVVRVDYSTVDAFFSEFTTNINEGGLFIETDRPSAVGTTVQLMFQLPGADEPLKVGGRVIWTTPGATSEAPGMGIEFEELDPIARDRVNAVVRRLRRDAGDSTASR